MRKIKRDQRFLPYVMGVVCGYILTLLLAVIAALLLLITDSSEAFSGTASVVIMAISCFFAGRSAGKLHRHDGLKTGALCGLLYFAPLVLLGIFFRTIGGVMLIVKAMLCIAFGTAGGVIGVNSDDK